MSARADRLDYRFLREINLFETLSDRDLKKIFSLGKTRECREETSIVVEGQPGGKLHILMDGRAEVWKATKGGLGREKRLAKLEPGAVFGEMSVFDRAPYSATVRAVDRCSVYVIDGKVFKQFLQKNPSTAFKFFSTLMALMANRMRRLNLTLSLLEIE